MSALPENARTSAGALSARLAPADVAAAIRALGSEPKTCPVCAGNGFERLFQRAGKWFWRCGTCTLVFVHDIYPEFLELADDLRERYSFERPASAGPRMRRKFDDFLKRLGRPGRLLEVGCGQGLFLERARELGWDVHGVEILEPVHRHAVARGLPVFLGTLEEARFPARSFDAVVMREVIEHIVAPVPLLTEVERVLRPGGIAALGTGNAASWAARLRGGRWSYYRFGGQLHIRFYSPASAAALARAAGFATVACRTSGFAFREAEELQGRWYKPVVKLAQGPISTLATALGAGHRLVMLLGKAP